MVDIILDIETISGAFGASRMERELCRMGKNEFLSVLTEMVTFVRVAETGSFSAAARLMQVSPSAVSKQVGRLEKVLGAQLVIRTTRKLQVTEVGMEVFRKCVDLVDAAQGTMQVAERFMKYPQGLVRISAPKAFAKHVLHPAVMDFITMYPEVDVHLMVTDQVVDPMRDGVDLVVQITKQPPLNLASRPLMPVEQILCASPDFLRASDPIQGPKDLVGVNCLYIGEHERDNWWRFIKDCEIEEIVVKGRYISNHSEMRLEAMIRGMGVGCVPDFVARAALESGSIQRVLPDWELEVNYHGTAHLLYPPNRFLTPKCRAFIDFLVEHVRQRHHLSCSLDH